MANFDKESRERERLILLKNLRVPLRDMPLGSAEAVGTAGDIRSEGVTVESDNMARPWYSRQTHQKERLMRSERARMTRQRCRRSVIRRNGFTIALLALVPYERPV